MEIFYYFCTEMVKYANQVTVCGLFTAVMSISLRLT